MIYRAAFSLLFAVAGALAQPALPSAPEALAGRWEVRDLRGGVVGMNIRLSTWVDPAGTVPSQQPNEREFVIAVFRRAEMSADPAQYNFFVARPGGAASWDGHRLSIWSNYDVNLAIDLVWNERSETWDGLFSREDFRQYVSLKKPTTSSPDNPFAGTWVNPSRGQMNNCLHIARQEDGSLTAWSDDVQIPLQVHRLNPTRTLEHYGEIGRVITEAANQITVTLGAQRAGCLLA